MIAFGYLIAETTAPLKNKHTFMGIEAHRKTPIEVAAIALIGGCVGRHTLLIVDSFQEMAKVKPDYVKDGKKALNAKLEALQQAFGFEVNHLESSSFAQTACYDAIYNDVSRQIVGSPLETELRKALPEGVTDLKYALHEVATTRFMQLEYGVEIKVGQIREKLYDAVISAVTGMDFAYLFPFFAFGTGEIVKTPYSPDSGTKNGGKRIMLGDGPERVAEVIKQGPLGAQIALTRLGFAATALQGSRIALSEKYPQPENCLNSVEALVEQVEVTRLRRMFGKYRYLG